MSDFVRVGTIDDFPESRPRRVRVEGIDVAVVRLKDRIYALKDACPHMGASLADGKVEGRTLTCHWHGWHFDLETGQGDARQWACAKVYEVEQRNNEVFLKPPPEPPPKEEPQEEWIPWDDKYLKGNKDNEGN